MTIRFAAKTVALVMLLSPLTFAAQSQEGAHSGAVKEDTPPIKLDCRGKLNVFNGRWSESAAEGLIVLDTDRHENTYSVGVFEGQYRVTKLSDDEIVFTGLYGGREAWGGINRYSGNLTLNTADFQVYAKLVCQPAKRMF